MSFISEQLEKRKLPPLGFEGRDPEERRKELVDTLSEHIYGRTPDFDSKVSAKVTYAHHDCFAGHAKHFHYDLTVTTPGGDFTFPLRLSYPKSDKKIPLIVSISFDPLIPSGFTPDEEICSKGVALAKFVYTDVAADRYDDCKEGVAALFPRKEGARDLWGKIGMWAWAASRALDFLLTLDLFDPERIAVEGHSRLGKTALWCGAQDTRFKYVFSNNAGCSGDAITRGKKGEDIGYITKTFGYWFCDRYKDYAGDGIEKMPFDQHWLIAASAPRHVAVGASSLDEWADPESENLCCAAASPAWEAFGKPGFVAPEDRFVGVDESYSDGYVAFHNREGEHSPCLADWRVYTDIILS